MYGSWDILTGINMTVGQTMGLAGSQRCSEGEAVKRESRTSVRIPLRFAFLFSSSSAASRPLVLNHVPNPKVVTLIEAGFGDVRVSQYEM